MGRWAGQHPARFVITVALTGFAVVSVVPIWTAWYVGSWETTAELASFWTMLLSVPRAAEQVSARRLVLTFYGPECVKLVIVLSIGLAIGRWLVWRSR